MGFAMQKKFTRKIVLLVVSFLAVSTFFACVEEPFIEPSVIPFSVLRIGNLTENVDELAVSIDGEFPVPALQSLQMDNFTDYFDLVAGRRYFVIMDPANGDTLFEKWIEVQSYEEQTMWYAGYYSSNIDTTTANFFIHSDAFTYISKDPPPENLNLYFLHSAADIPSDDSRAYDVVAYSIDGSDTTEVGDDPIVEGLLFGEIQGNVMLDSDYKFEIVRVIDNEILDTYVGSFSEGLWSWMYIVGEPSTPRIVREDKEPLPARPK
jgi:hypothetical protein